MQIRHTTASLILAAALAVTLAACSAPSTTAPPSTSGATTKPTATAKAAAPAASSFVTADWAKPVTNPGDLIATGSGTNFRIDIYQAGVTKATRTGNFADPKTNKPLIEVGSDIVFVNYVLTNTSTADIPLSISLANVSPRYDDWQYLQGMDGVSDRALYETMHVYNGIDAFASYKSVAPYIWKPGTSYSNGTNFLHEAKGAITFNVSLTQALASGDLDHSKNQKLEVKAVIK